MNDETVSHKKLAKRSWKSFKRPLPRINRNARESRILAAAHAKEFVPGSDIYCRILTEQALPQLGDAKGLSHQDEDVPTREAELLCWNGSKSLFARIDDVDIELHYAYAYKENGTNLDLDEIPLYKNWSKIRGHVWRGSEYDS